MSNRLLAGKPVSAVGLGCMNLSHAYGVPPSEADAERVLLRALDLGVTHFDTAALYGFGRNETLVGRVLKPHRDEILLASKCGMTGVDGKRVIDGRPDTIKRTCEEALLRLQTDFIDLYYLHRWDKTIAIEESVGALSDLVRDGKIGAIGLSEVSAATMRKAHAVHPIAAMQTEYSLYTRNPEIAVLEACRELGAAFVAFSPVARGLICGGATGEYVKGDIRAGMPRFNTPHIAANLTLAEAFAAEASKLGVAPATLAIAWVLHQGAHVHAIPGTTSIAHLEQDVAAATLSLTPAQLDRLSAIIPRRAVSGPRYPAQAQADVDTEEFAD